MMHEFGARPFCPPLAHPPGIFYTSSPAHSDGETATQSRERRRVALVVREMNADIRSYIDGRFGIIEQKLESIVCRLEQVTTVLSPPLLPDGLPSNWFVPGWCSFVPYDQAANMGVAPVESAEQYQIHASNSVQGDNEELDDQFSVLITFHLHSAANNYVFDDLTWLKVAKFDAFTSCIDWGVFALLGNFPLSKKIGRRFGFGLQAAGKSTSSAAQPTPGPPPVPVLPSPQLPPLIPLLPACSSISSASESGDLGTSNGSSVESSSSPSLDESVYNNDTWTSILTDVVRPRVTDPCPCELCLSDSIVCQALILHVAIILRESRMVPSVLRLCESCKRAVIRFPLITGFVPDFIPCGSDSDSSYSIYAVDANVVMRDMHGYATICEGLRSSLLNLLSNMNDLDEALVVQQDLTGHNFVSTAEQSHALVAGVSESKEDVDRPDMSNDRHEIGSSGIADHVGNADSCKGDGNVHRPLEPNRANKNATKRHKKKKG